MDGLTASEKISRQLERATPDHLPTCPHCGNLCGRLATKCADCGCALYPPHVTLQLATEVGSASMARRRRIAAQVREDAKAARERGD